MRNLRDAVFLLWEKAEDRLTLDEVSMFSGGMENAQHLAQDLAVICGSLAALVAEDSENGNAGNFQNGEEVQALLRTLECGSDQVATLIGLARRAEPRRLEMMGWNEIEAYEKAKHLRKVKS
ncbi:hypothetical protein [Thauera sp. SDU_THAU2]|uniref:hypothetical protein n=1 Tax=Thauera sp. SDU_THAU2 TaxID=3136633 RepID=UPI00311F0596